LIPTGLDLKDNGTLLMYFLKRPRRGLNSALDADIGFVERLVWFWSNHFCVSPIRAACALSAEPMNARQSAPQMRGKFVDMLVAVESHPAVLLYNDNARSIATRVSMKTARGGLSTVSTPSFALNAPIARAAQSTDHQENQQDR
jgi:uncharacterized protein (DUF1800 family)